MRGNKSQKQEVGNIKNLSNGLQDNRVIDVGAFTTQAFDVEDLDAPKDQQKGTIWHLRNLSMVAMNRGILAKLKV